MSAASLFPSGFHILLLYSSHLPVFSEIPWTFPCTLFFLIFNFLVFIYWMKNYIN